MGGTLLSGCQIPFRQYCAGLPVCGNSNGAEMPDTLLGPEGSGHYRAPAPPSGVVGCSKCLSFWSSRAHCVSSARRGRMRFALSWSHDTRRMTQAGCPYLENCTVDASIQ
jgi:hypothetical protein